MSEWTGSEYRKLSDKLLLYKHKGVCVFVCGCVRAEFRNLIKLINFKY